MTYTIGVAIVIAASLVIEFPWFACGTSALLVWLANVPGSRSSQLKGMAIYIGFGAVLVGLGYVLAGTFWPGGLLKVRPFTRLEMSASLQKLSVQYWPQLSPFQTPTRAVCLWS